MGLGKSVGRCHECGSRALSEGAVREVVTLAGAMFEARLPALVCPCGEAYLDCVVLEQFELSVAAELGRLGWAGAEAMRFARKALGYSATNMAALLGVSLETVSRWENGKVPVDTRSFVLLCRLAQDRLDGRPDTERMLRAITEPAVRVTRTSVAVRCA
jgi:YgiT-type zinc finger domain-containing protein